MFELRWVMIGMRDVLQFRTKTLKHNNWGEIIGESEWSKWKEVPYAHT